MSIFHTVGIHCPSSHIKPMVVNSIVHSQLFNVHEKSGSAWYAIARDHPNHEVRSNICWCLCDLFIHLTLLLNPTSGDRKTQKSQQVSQETKFITVHNRVDSRSVPGEASLNAIAYQTLPLFSRILKSWECPGDEVEHLNENSAMAVSILTGVLWSIKIASFTHRIPV